MTNSTRAIRRQQWREFNRMVGKKNRCSFDNWPAEEARYYAVTRMGGTYEQLDAT